MKCPEADPDPVRWGLDAQEAQGRGQKGAAGSGHSAGRSSVAGRERRGSGIQKRTALGVVDVERTAGLGYELQEARRRVSAFIRRAGEPGLHGGGGSGGGVAIRGSRACIPSAVRGQWRCPRET